MSLELLQQIQRAEEQGEAIRQDALRQAREILKATEGACVQQERLATQELRSLYQQLLSAGRKRKEAELAQLSEQAAAERQLICANAEARLDDAAALIVKRLLDEGR